MCAREGCEEVIYDRRAHNQIYHDSECTRIATNQRIMQKYYERRARKMGLARYCIECKVTRLSRYNEESKCSACRSKERKRLTSQLHNMIDSMSIA